MSMKVLLDEIYLNAEKTAADTYIIHLSNGKEITVIEHPLYDGNEWSWQIDTQIFDKDQYAEKYFRELIAEKLTGIRIIYHKKKEAPDICGFGQACRSKEKCNTALCFHCSVAEKFFADKDGVQLIYAVN